MHYCVAQATRQVCVILPVTFNTRPWGTKQAWGVTGGRNWCHAPDMWGRGQPEKNETQRILASIQLRKFIAQIRVCCKPHNEFLMILLEGLWCFGNLTTTLTWTHQQQTGAKSMFSRKYKRIQWAVENMAHLNQVFKWIKLPFVLEQWLHNGELRN